MSLTRSGYSTSKHNDGENVLVRAVVSRSTEGAFLLDQDGEEVWAPRSQIANEADLEDADDTEESEVWMPLWLAKKKGLTFE